ncbi:glucose-1-phosphate adenylyltransferase [Pontibacillus salicampi]|uniref:Glucose-1-phosphate adenylyltransferase n=1 Tax=Pontibacillus salicampi TaxID=1449801 RepID=A0ABV6LIG4_9BACI
MGQPNMIAMLLAGGEGKRLGELTSHIAKPVVSFGGKYRIIDFALSNCANSGIDTIGVLTQYEPQFLHSYVGVGDAWDLNRRNKGLSILPPYVHQQGSSWYKGTAHAMEQNIPYMELQKPTHVLVLSGDHIYQMDYSSMLEHHQRSGAEVTIAGVEVPIEQAPQFGIMQTDENGFVVDFKEKPDQPASSLASMGVYIFEWETLRAYLSQHSSRDFGRDVIPALLEDEREVGTFTFNGYWRDVGTVESLWQANMDLLEEKSGLDLGDRDWRIRSVPQQKIPQYISASAFVKQSLITEGCEIYGSVTDSVVSTDSFVSEGSTIQQSVLMPHSYIGSNATIQRAIIGEGAVVPDGAVIGSDTGEITVWSNTKQPVTITCSNGLGWSRGK